MSKAVQAVRGVKDLLPDASARWQHVEAIARDVLAAYGYRELRLPIIEKTELFARSIGEHTDIVEKEMYTFEDRNGDRLTLRPEGTAGCVRAGIEHGLLYNQVQRFWYTGPMFRHERPQKGRYRQFHQIGVEAFGLAGPDIDAEVILLSARLWRALALDGLTLYINSLGTAAARAAYRDKLVGFLRGRVDELDEDSRRRLETNPLRVLDSKHPSMQTVIAEAPQLLEHLDDASREHFARLREYLDAAGVRYEINPRLVRGLDYYSRTVFEWQTDKLGAQSAVCAGGRYDGLVELLGGKPTPAIGFALGLERLIELLTLQDSPVADLAPHVYIAVAGAAQTSLGLTLAEMLRTKGLRVELHCGGGNLGNQLKRADRSGARFALILGESEQAADAVTVKDLRRSDAQRQLAQRDVADHLLQQLKTE